MSEPDAPATSPDPLSWRRLPPAARIYVAAIIVAGAAGLVVSVPRSYPQPLLFAALVALSCLTSAWKVTLPLSLASGATLSVSYAADLMALLLIGPRAAVVVAIAGAWTQCTFKVKRRYPLYRTGFSMSAEVVTMAATGFVYVMLGGSQAGPLIAAVAALSKWNSADTTDAIC